MPSGSVNTSAKSNSPGIFTQHHAQQCLPKSPRLYSDPKPPAIAPGLAALEPGRVVLDTNVVLDWLLFDDAGTRALAAALAGGRLRWVATAAMRDELGHVVARDTLARWQPDLPALWSHWERHCIELPAAPPAGAPLGRFRCSDPDDQKFIDLAVSAGAGLLLSRDRAVLKLARVLAPLGVRVTTPARWSALPLPATRAPRC
jgi:predicted nucleic acid-binding protein